MPALAPIPTDLSSTTRRWAQRVFERYRLVPDSTEHRILVEAARALDRAQEAKEVLDREGLTVTGSRGQVSAHPAAAIERDSRTLFARLIRDLNLTPEQAGPGA